MAGERWSRGDRLLLTAVLAVFGLAVAGYLTSQSYDAALSSWCDLDATFSCTRVRESAFAAVAGVPAAWVGVVGFAILLGLAFLALSGRGRLGPWAVDRWILGFAEVGAAVGTALTAVEVFVIQAVCILCVIGFALDLGVLAIAAVQDVPSRADV